MPPPILIALDVLFPFFLLPFIELLWIIICKSVNLTSIHGIFIS